MNKAKKDPDNGTWSIQYRYTDWQGEQHKSTKRGFKTKREAENWLSTFLTKQEVNFDMKMKDFIDIYMEDCRSRLRENTILTKEYIINDKILPYFGKKAVNSITAADIRRWQNELIGMSTAGLAGKPLTLPWESAVTVMLPTGPSPLTVRVIRSLSPFIMEPIMAPADRRRPRAAVTTGKVM